MIALCSLRQIPSLVILEALLFGVPVAAYPAPGPLDLIENGYNGWVSEDLNHAINEALSLQRGSRGKTALLNLSLS